MASGASQSPDGLRSDLITLSLARAVVAWMGFARRMAWLVVPAALVALVLSVQYIHARVGFDASPLSLAKPDLNRRQVERDFRARFPLAHEPILAVIDGPAEEPVHEAAAALIERIGRDPGVVHVYDPQGVSELAGLRLLSLDEEQMRRFEGRLLVLQPLMGGLPEKPRIGHLTTRLTELARREHAGDLLPVPVLDALTDAMEAALKGNSTPVSWLDLVFDRRPDSGHRRILRIAPDPAQREGQALKKLADRLRAAAGSLSLGEGVRVRITGQGLLSVSDSELAEFNWVALFLATGLAGLMLYLGIRSMRIAVAVGISALLAGTAAVGLAVFFFGTVNLLSGAAVLVSAALATHFSINLGMAYFSGRIAALPNDRALVGAGMRTGAAMIMAAVTAFGSGFALIILGRDGIVEFGTVSAAGGVIALAVTVTFMPAFLHMFKAPEGPRDSIQGVSMGAVLAGMGFNYRRMALLPLLLLSVIGAGVIPLKAFDGNPLSIYGIRGEAAVTFRELLAEPVVSPWHLNTQVNDFSELAALSERLNASNAVSRTDSLLSYLPPGQEGRLKRLARLRLLMGGFETARTQGPRGAGADLMKSLPDLRAALRSLNGQRIPPELATAVGRLAETSGVLRDRLKNDLAGRRNLIRHVERAILGTYPVAYGLVSEALNTGELTEKRLPRDLVDYWKSSDGLLRMEIMPSSAVDNVVGMADYMEGVRRVHRAIIGAPVDIYRATATVGWGMAKGVLLMLMAGVALVMLVGWRWTDGLLMGGALMGLVFTVSAWIWLSDEAWNYVNIAFLPLILLLGMASAMQVLVQGRAGLPVMENLMSAPLMRPQWVVLATVLVALVGGSFALPLGGDAMREIVVLGLLVAAMTPTYAVAVLLTPQILVATQ
ncbi:MAG: MMPL family transporter [Gammaproteobacteria bacterium]